MGKVWLHKLVFGPSHLQFSADRASRKLFVFAPALLTTDSLQRFGFLFAKCTICFSSFLDICFRLRGHFTCALYRYTLYANTITSATHCNFKSSTRRKKAVRRAVVKAVGWRSLRISPTQMDRAGRASTPTRSTTLACTFPAGSAPSCPKRRWGLKRSPGTPTLTPAPGEGELHLHNPSELECRVNSTPLRPLNLLI